MNDMYDLRMYNNLNVINTNKFFNENEGFNKGNMQRDIYDNYKGYVPMSMNPSSDQDRLMMEIQKYGFVLTDLTIYLDLNSDDVNALNYYHEARNKYLKLISEFNHKYYPLMAIDNKDKYLWSESAFPFLGGK